MRLPGLLFFLCVLHDRLHASAQPLLMAHNPTTAVLKAALCDPESSVQFQYSTPHHTSCYLILSQEVHIFDASRKWKPVESLFMGVERDWPPMFFHLQEPQQYSYRLLNITTHPQDYTPEEQTRLVQQISAQANSIGVEEPVDFQDFYEGLLKPLHVLSLHAVPKPLYEYSHYGPKPFEVRALSDERQGDMTVTFQIHVAQEQRLYQIILTHGGVGISADDATSYSHQIAERVYIGVIGHKGFLFCGHFPLHYSYYQQKLQISTQAAEEIGSFLNAVYHDTTQPLKAQRAP